MQGERTDGQVAMALGLDHFSQPAANPTDHVLPDVPIRFVLRRL
jgi:hypothetical protein